MNEQEACVVGCHLQATTAALKPSRTASQDTPSKNPLAIFQRMVINLAGHVGRLMRFTWAWTSRGQQEWQQQEKIEGELAEAQGRTGAGEAED